MPQCCVDGCEEASYGRLWIAIALDAIPTGYLELHAPVCREHYQSGAKLPSNVHSVAVQAHL